MRFRMGRPLPAHQNTRLSDMFIHAFLFGYTAHGCASSYATGRQKSAEGRCRRALQAVRAACPLYGTVYTIGVWRNTFRAHPSQKRRSRTCRALPATRAERDMAGVHAKVRQRLDKGFSLCHADEDGGGNFPSLTITLARTVCRICVYCACLCSCCV